MRTKKLREYSIDSLIKTLFTTSVALTAFAANSVLCRLALGEQTIDAASFTMIRLLSGAIVLFLILQLPGKTSNSTSKGSWFAASMLFLYAISFSFAYITLDTGTGALILFGSVQLTMILITLYKGTRLHTVEWAGVLISFSGFVFLILPGISTPSFSGFILMTVAGTAWGIYTLAGRDSVNPLADTTQNFIKTIPLIIIIGIITIFTNQDIQLSQKGIVLAVLSGAIASGIGYTIWYMALADLTAAQAAVVQLLVPVIAAAGGVIFVDEIITSRLLFSSVMILGGILLVVSGRYYLLQKKTT